MDYQEVVETLQDIHDVAESRIKNGDARGVIYIPRDKLDDLKTAISAIQELNEYKQLGTPEEVREAVEKQTAKKPIEDRHHGIRYTEVYRCPSCNGSFSGKGFAKYCFHCGKKIDWSDEE